MYKKYIMAICLVAVVFGCCVINLTAKDRSYDKVDMLASMKPGDKAAMVMVYFGSTHNDTRELTINALTQKAVKAFPSMDVKEAWTSRIVMRRIAERTGEKILNPTQMLERLKKEGYTHVVLQPSNIIEGIEMEALREEADNFVNDFKDIRVGDPLLYTVADVEGVAVIIGEEYAAQVGPDKKCAACGKCEKSRKGSPVIFVGHGTYTPTTATYSMLEYILHSKLYPNAFVGTIEGHPSIEDAAAQVAVYYKEAEKLKKNVVGQVKANAAVKAGSVATDSIIRKVTLVPFMFVAGEHAKNDINEEWKEFFATKGYKVEVVTKGLGELPKIQDLFIEHAKFALQNRPVSILDKKAKYAGEEIVVKK